jgi:hypothetical protein
MRRPSRRHFAENRPMPAAAIRNPEQLASDGEMHDLIEKAGDSVESTL